METIYLLSEEKTKRLVDRWEFCRLFQVEKISIGNDSRGPGHGVFVEEIEVAAPSEEAVVFPCRCWLAEDEGDGKSTRVLQPGETVSPPYDSE